MLIGLSPLLELLLVADEACSAAPGAGNLRRRMGAILCRLVDSKALWVDGRTSPRQIGQEHSSTGLSCAPVPRTRAVGAGGSLSCTGEIGMLLPGRLRSGGMTSSARGTQDRFPNGPGQDNLHLA